MQQYTIPLVPGPVSVPAAIRDLYGCDFGASDLEEDFFDLYTRCERGLQTLLATQNPVAILSGEGMLALWGAMKSVIRPGDRVLAVATGVFGYGFADMARQLGAEVEVVGFELRRRGRAGAGAGGGAARFGRGWSRWSTVRRPAARSIRWRRWARSVARWMRCIMWILSPARAARRCWWTRWGIDLGLLGSQKVLSLMPDLAMVSISDRAWAAIDETGYVGYDALAPWRTAIADRYMPYTHNWQAMAGLEAALNGLFDGRAGAAYARHAEVAALCRDRLQAMGVALWPVSEAICSPTVTAARVPEGWTWAELDGALRRHGMVVGGSYGPLADKVFRIGHMGSQADPELVQRGMDVLAQVLRDRRR